MVSTTVQGLIKKKWLLWGGSNQRPKEWITETQQLRPFIHGGHLQNWYEKSITYCSNNTMSDFNHFLNLELRKIIIWNQNFKFKISFFGCHNSRYLTPPRQTFACVLSSYQGRMVELWQPKKDISDTKNFYYIKIKKVGNLGFDQQF